MIQMERIHFSRLKERGEVMHYGYDRNRGLRGSAALLPRSSVLFFFPSFTPELLVNFLSTANKRNVPLRNICSDSL